MKNYDKKVKQTRILLSDYLLLKGFAQKAGVSMAVALHRLIEHIAQLPLPKSQPTFQVSAPVALRVKSQPTIATNGHKAVAFRIKPKGVRYE